MQNMIPPGLGILCPQWVQRMVRHFEEMEQLSENQRCFYAHLCRLQTHRGHQVH